MSTLIAGVDEAGRGPLAGPVAAAAVIFRRGRMIGGIKDSKLLDAARRDELGAAIRRHALCFGIGWADAAEIDALNILEATFLAMRRAVLALSIVPDSLAVDGDRLPELTGLGRCASATAVVRGDQSLRVISAASILAKTARDAYMVRADALYPAYRFAEHKGYGTEVHMRLLRQFGPSPMHRRSFAPVAQLAAERSVGTSACSAGVAP
ncbi:MAG TPA: ribonuclease HII [Steroidobacteraceae bacterium]|nr:ribonuclease HII [Steroidobacteraceae bacterium]